VLWLTSRLRVVCPKGGDSLSHNLDDLWGSGTAGQAGNIKQGTSYGTWHTKAYRKKRRHAFNFLDNNSSKLCRICPRPSGRVCGCRFDESHKVEFNIAEVLITSAIL
jgi:hypothetical protein